MAKKNRRSLYGPRPSIRPGVAPPAAPEVAPDQKFPTLKVLAYDPQQVVELEIKAPKDLKKLPTGLKVTWVHVSCEAGPARLKEIAETFNLPALALEDVMDKGQRTKVEDLGDYTFVVLHTLERREQLLHEQLSLFFTDKTVISFQEGPAEYLEPVRARILKSSGRTRNSSADYLAYSIMDSAVDHYFPAIDHYGNLLAELEDKVLENPSKEVISLIHSIKRDLLGLSRTLWPLREVMSTLLHEDTSPMTKQTRLFVRDCHDHVLQAMDLVTAYREAASSLTDIYLSALSNRLNEVMKVLTIIATIFIPLTFIAGVYGMNFDPRTSPWNMPELDWRWGYPAVMLVMLLVAGGLLYYFKRKKWL
ncbi:MAG: magnesium/cobalt transporter CorA [Thermodesulfobacteriota bacterium]